MTYWLYEIDWRTRAVEIISAHDTRRQAELAHAGWVVAMTREQLEELGSYKTMGIAMAGEAILKANEQFNRPKVKA